ncbi:glycosyltransferase 87 family protein [Nocardioides korecus]
MTEAPTLVDPVARSLSEVAGGPVGRHARPHPWWSPVRVLLVLCAVGMALAIVQHTPCTSTNWSSDQARYSKMCYSDVPYLYTGRGLAEGRWPYADSGGRYEAMEYPVGISYLAWGTALLTQLDPSGPPVAERRLAAPGSLWGLPGMTQETNTYFLLTAVLLAGLALLTTWLVAGVHRRRPWDALMLVLSPCLLATALVNWDLLAVVMVAGALWAWSRDRSTLTGVMIGLGTAAKLYPLFLLGPVLVIAWRRKQPGEAARAIAAAAATWLLVNAPALATGPQQWLVFWRFNSARAADLGSAWLALTDAGGSYSVHTINTWSWVLFAAVCAGVAVLGLRAPRTPRLAQLGFLVVVGFLAVNKVYSPQYVLWLLPLAVLARPRWRDQLIWQAGEMVYFVAVWMYLGHWLEEAAGGRSPAYDLAIWVRLAAELYLAVVVVRDVLRPEHDPVLEEREVPGGAEAALPERDREPALG